MKHLRDQEFYGKKRKVNVPSLCNNYQIIDLSLSTVNLYESKVKASALYFRYSLGVFRML